MLVTGAAGFTGRALVKRLLEAGAEVIAIVRPARQCVGEGLNVRWHYGDVFDEAVVRAATRDVHYIFHLASHFRDASATEAMHVAVHMRSTQLLAAAALGAPDFQRFIHVSTVGVHGHVTKPPADENSPLAPEDVYQRTKAEAETWVRDFAVRNSLPFTIVRPTPIFGPGDRRLLKLFRVATWPIVPVPSRGLCHYHLIHVDDLVEAMLVAAIHPAARNQTFILGNPEPILIEDFIRLAARGLGREHVRLIHVPFWPLLWTSVACETVCRWFGLKPTLNRRRVGFFVMNRWFDTSKAQSLLGFHPRYS
ncbi:MAG: NAD(P)-dependent oxidoreductase, partial [Lentisphaerae bacterium]|nr:NAD(P)-dependent oxidoreductase [Lentisphaerota bacterium]